MTCQATQYELPVIGYTFRTKVVETESELSSALKASGFSMAHNHSWKFLHSSGNSRFGISNDASYLSVLQDKAFADGLLRLLKYLSKVTQEAMVEKLMSPSHSEKLYYALLDINILSIAAMSDSEIQLWVQHHREHLEGILDLESENGGTGNDQREIAVPTESLILDGMTKP